MSIERLIDWATSELVGTDTFRSSMARVWCTYWSLSPIHMYTTIFALFSNCAVCGSDEDEPISSISFCRSTSIWYLVVGAPLMVSLPSWVARIAAAYVG